MANRLTWFLSWPCGEAHPSIFAGTGSGVSAPPKRAYFRQLEALGQRPHLAGESSPNVTFNFVEDSIASFKNRVASSFWRQYNAHYTDYAYAAAMHCRYLP